MKTLLDLHNSAAAAAAGTLDLTTALGVDKAALESFHADKHDPLDYEEWRRMFATAREEQLRMRATQAPSAQAQKAD